jgi:hypothetical protein
MSLNLRPFLREATWNVKTPDEYSKDSLRYSLKVIGTHNVMIYDFNH